jgi:hypothetical protein
LIQMRCIKPPAPEIAVQMSAQNPRINCLAGGKIVACSSGRRSE